MEYLEFEESIKEIDEQIEKAKALEIESGVDMKESLQELESKLLSTQTEIKEKLTAWQRVQLSRHPSRPHTLAYLEAMTNNSFIELHGDRTVKDDKAMVGGWGMINDESYLFIGQQKGVNTKMRQLRNFGMPNPEGYRKALRLMKQAEKFGRPVVALIDTPGAFPGVEAEERGQGEAIARNILEMSRLKVPIICIVIGEGASGGALGIGVGDKVIMLENTWYSVISPESCSSILWRSWDHKERAAEALKLTAKDMLSNGLIDGVINEPAGGAHRNPIGMFNTLSESISNLYAELKKIPTDDLIQNRVEKFCRMGVYEES
ncbi:MAG: acetyl-CoA carboxylase carboxyltransferase subunit alpha [Schleiferiaceae bacterium]|nr:acetyl-CoA carboxylase carboxyltransferase subunit alpha [Schleiferiaceae bacterium]